MAEEKIKTTRSDSLLGPRMPLSMKLTLANFGLVLLIAATVWQSLCTWRFYEDRQATIYLPPVAVAAPQLDDLPRVMAPSIREYAIITKSILFFPDRGSSPAPEPKIMPPFSGTLRGVIDLGNDPIVLMSEQFGGEVHALRPGGRVGSFTLVAVNRDELVLEWEGEYLRLPVRQWMSRRPSGSPQATWAQGTAR
jgi:hypothetical protein